MARLAMYLRRSSPGEDDKNYSLEDQQRDIESRWEEYASHLLISIYKDPGGKSYELNRPVFQQLLADARAKKFDIVVVGKWDRFSRMQDQQAVAIYMLKKYGVQVVSATQPLADGPLGTAQRNLYAFSAELELHNLRERTHGGKRERVLDNKLPNQGRPKYGYLFADDPGGRSKDRKTHYVPDPDAEPVVRRIHQMYFDGLTIMAIGSRLTQEGVPTPTQLWEMRGQLPKNKRAATMWRTSTIADILSDTAYIGKLVGWRTVRTTVTRVDRITGDPVEYVGIRLRDAGDRNRVEYGPDVCPPIVDEKIFLANRETTERNQQLSSRNLRDPKQVLLSNGIGICGYCGKHLRAQFAKIDRQYRYVCGGNSHEDGCPGKNWSWRTREIDRWVWDFFMLQFDDPDVLRMKYDIWKTERVSGRSVQYDELGVVEEQIASAEQHAKNARANSLDARTDEDRAEWARIAEDEARKARNLAVRRESLADSIGRDEQEEDAVQALVSLGPEAKERLRTADFDSKRRFLHAFKVCVKLKGRKEPPNEQWAFSWELGAVYNRWVQSHLDLQAHFCIRSQQ